MIDALLSLPTLAGCLVFMAITAAVGLAIYYVTFQFHTKRQNDESFQEVKDATDNLFRVVGWLFTLLLSLTFTDVIGELTVTERAIENESAVVQDIHHGLQRFSLEETGESRKLLVDYAKSVTDEDWLALAGGNLSTRTDAILRDLGDAILNLETSTPRQETLKSNIIADVDSISDFRLTRLQQAKEEPSTVLIVVVFGYLVTMVLFGIYQPRPALVVLLSLYAIFVGVVIYLILAMSDPFQGTWAVDTAPMEYALEKMQSDK
jgi:hypothetical protein